MMYIIFKRINMAETKREKFVRLAEARTNKIINMIRLLGNCSNATTYEYTSEDVKKIFSKLDTELKNARARFDNSASPEDSVFKL